jgi:hypothetical protein
MLEPMPTFSPSLRQPAGAPSARFECQIRHWSRIVRAHPSALTDRVTFSRSGGIPAAARLSFTAWRTASRSAGVLSHAVRAPPRATTARTAASTATGRRRRGDATGRSVWVCCVPVTNEPSAAHPRSLTIRARNLTGVTSDRPRGGLAPGPKRRHARPEPGVRTVVGWGRFELPASSSRTRRAAKLRHHPWERSSYRRGGTGSNRWFRSLSRLVRRARPRCHRRARPRRHVAAGVRRGA